MSAALFAARVLILMKLGNGSYDDFSISKLTNEILNMLYSVFMDIFPPQHVTYSADVLAADHYTLALCGILVVILIFFCLFYLTLNLLAV